MHERLESHKHHAIPQDLVLSRALALEATTSVLLDYSARRAYDRSHQVEVSYADMPGKRSSMPRPPLVSIMQPQLDSRTAQATCQTQKAALSCIAAQRFPSR